MSKIEAWRGLKSSPGGVWAPLRNNIYSYKYTDFYCAPFLVFLGSLLCSFSCLPRIWYLFGICLVSLWYPFGRGGYQRDTKGIPNRYQRDTKQIPNTYQKSPPGNPPSPLPPTFLPTFLGFVGYPFLVPFLDSFITDFGSHSGGQNPPQYHKNRFPEAFPFGSSFGTDFGFRWCPILETIYIQNHQNPSGIMPPNRK